MIMVKTPFRISLVGGGTDLPAFYQKNGYGAVVSMSIKKYMYVMIHPYFHDKLRVKYSQTEDVDSIDDLKHPLARECLRLMKLNTGIEIASIADIPAGLGLGSSSSFTVCLLHALHAYQGRHVTKEQLAEEACQIEIDRLKEPIGKQDQYASAYGGLNFVKFNANGSVEVDRFLNNQKILSDLMERLLVFYIGRPRSARDILTEQQNSIGKGDRFKSGQQLVQLTHDMQDALVSGKMNRIGEILHQGWLLKRQLASNITDSEIDRIYSLGLSAGASGGKLLGAGAGGFMLFYCEPDAKENIRKKINLREISIEGDSEGSKVIYAE